jgi:hypothetical protein
MSAVSQSLAHIILQEAILLLSQWSEAGLNFQSRETSTDAEAAINTAKTLIGWSNNWEPAPLKLVFDTIRLKEGQAKS